MKHFHRLFVVLTILFGLGLSACGAAEIPVTGEENPATVEHLEGAQPTRVTLTEEAAKRLDIQTAKVQDNAIPYAAVLYDTDGNTWVYVNTAPFVFMRSSVTVDHIDGDKAFLSKGLPDGSAVVTIGAEELYGSETEFEEE